MLSNKLRSVLRKARLRLSNPRRWIQGSLISHNDFGEKCYCLLGSVQEGNNLSSHENNQVVEALRQAIQNCGFRYDDVASFNDSTMRKHPTILRVLDSALQTA